jgi:hypothetical protein
MQLSVLCRIAVVELRQEGVCRRGCSFRGQPPELNNRHSWSGMPTAMREGGNRQITTASSCRERRFSVPAVASARLGYWTSVMDSHYLAHVVCICLLSRPNIANLPEIEQPKLTINILVLKHDTGKYCFRLPLPSLPSVYSSPTVLGDTTISPS